MVSVDEGSGKKTMEVATHRYAVLPEVDRRKKGGGVKGEITVNDMERIMGKNGASY